FVDTQEHFMVADASGRSRVIEFIGGKMVVTAPHEAWQICTNHIVAGKSEQENDVACTRYRTGSDLADHFAGAVDFDGALQVTKAMSVDGYTMSSRVYHLTSHESCLRYKGKADNEYRDSIDPLGSPKSR